MEQAKQLAEAQQLRLKQQQQSARKLRKMIAGLAAVAVIAGVACIFALKANKRAQLNAEAAEARREEAITAQEQTKAALGQVEAQKTQVESSLTQAEEAEREARKAEARGRQLLYATDMQLAAQYWHDEQVGAKQLSNQLAAHIPKEGKTDLRGFEWHYMQHLVENSAAVFSGDEVLAIDSALTPAGHLVTLNIDAQLKRWDRETGLEVGETLDLAPGGPYLGRGAEPGWSAGRHCERQHGPSHGHPHWGGTEPPRSGF